MASRHERLLGLVTAHPNSTTRELMERLHAAGDRAASLPVVSAALSNLRASGRVISTGVSRRGSAPGAPNVWTAKDTDAYGEIRLDEQNAVDEVVASDVAFFHLERMDVGCVWMRLDLRDGSAIVINVSTKRPGTTAVDIVGEREPLRIRTRR